MGYVLVLIRAIFLFSFIFNHYSDVRLGLKTNLVSIGLIINLIFFVGTNGKAACLCFGVAIMLVHNEYKEKWHYQLGSLSILVSNKINKIKLI